MVTNKPNNKTSTKHFEIFKKECKFWIEKFGLKEWAVEFFHKNTNGLAGCSTSGAIDNLCSISLGKDWEHDVPTTKKIRRVAFHEICEMLLSDTKLAVPERFTDTVQFEFHKIIRRLERSMFKDSYKQRFNKKKNNDVKDL